MKQFRIPVGLTEYTVKFRKSVTFKGVACEGLCDPVKKILYIERRANDPDVMFATFWHEYCHAVFYELGHNDLAVNEVFIESISSNLARASRALPEAFK